MDGNGRWAKRASCRASPATARASRRCGGTVARRAEIGLEALTLYAFSSENWRRPEDEVADLMGLLKRFIISDLDEFAREQRAPADHRRLPRASRPIVVALLDNALTRTAANTG